DLRRQVAQAGIDDGRVLAFQEPDAADLVRQADGEPGDLSLQDLPGSIFQLLVDRREDRRDGDRTDALFSDVRRHPAQLVRVERRDEAAVELVASVTQV